MERPNHSPACNPSPETAGGATHPIMFWVLTLMALAVFAPCVLVPVYLEVEEARTFESQMRAAIGALEAQTHRNAAHIDALLADPLVNERIARRELNQQTDAQQVVRVSPRELAGLHLRVPEPLQASDTPEPVPPPQWVLAAGRWLPDWPWRELFGKAANRNLLLVASGGLLAAAFLLFGRIPVRRPTTP